MTLGEARDAVLRRLNDATHAFWTPAEIDGYVVQGYREVCRLSRALWDLRYAENLPRGFSYTHAWEAAMVTFDYGRANFTYEWERRLYDPEHDGEGPAAHTSPADVANDDSDLQGLAELPRTVTEIDRPLWDQRAIDVLTPRQAEATDSRYELTQGEVYGLVVSQQGPRTIRKVRVPAGVAATYTHEGSWGVLRDPTDCSAGTVTTEDQSRRFAVTAAFEIGMAARRGFNSARATYTYDWEDEYIVEGGEAVGPSNHTMADDYTLGTEAGLTMTTTDGAFGCPRRVPGHHPMGSESFGLPRRVYRDGTNVRIEHWREGRAVSLPSDVFEIPAYAVAYVRDYALGRCYGKQGPAQDLRLAEHYQQRYARGVARLTARVKAQQRARVSQLGGALPRRGGPPPRPRLPWQYGVVVR